MAYLIFDTETSGLPRNWRAPSSDVDNWPRLVQIGWITCDSEGNELDAREAIIRPDGFVISSRAASVHGITTARARREGVPLGPVLDAFRDAVQAAQVVAAHNADFDRKIMEAEFHRAGDRDAFRGKRWICTMKRSADHCRIPGRYGYKWPTLTQLHRHLFGEEFSGAHGAMADAVACRRCLFRLRELGVIT